MKILPLFRLPEVNDEYFNIINDYYYTVVDIDGKYIVFNFSRESGPIDQTIWTIDEFIKDKNNFKYLK